MGVADPPATARLVDAGAVRARYASRQTRVVVGAFGGVTPEKRLPEVLDAVASLAPDHPNLHLLLVGAPAAHYDVGRRGGPRHRRAGARHWVRARRRAGRAPAGRRHLCLLALAHERRDLGVVAAGDGRRSGHDDHRPGASARGAGRARARRAPTRGAPVAVAVPILDEAAGLRAALEQLAGSPQRRARLGAAPAPGGGAPYAR